MPTLVTDPASDLATLARLYPVILDRDADANGLAYWAAALEEGTATLADIAEGFLLTREGADGIAGIAEDAAFATALLARAYGREPTEAEVAAVVADLEGGASRAEAIVAVAGDPTAQAALDVTGAEGLTIEDFAPATFGFGVASGDPDATSVVLWTHARPGEDGAAVPVTWEVATDADFAEIVATGAASAVAEEDYTVKVIADGLEAGGEYFYRFTANGETSDIGQTSTLPEGELDAITFAVFSCSNLPAGFFNPYAEAAARGFDVSIFLGDYIYEYANGVFPVDPDRAGEINRVPRPNAELLTEADYSARYAQYTRDADLQAVRATGPMIVMWDDHETANDAWATGAENHQPETEGDWETRRDMALEVYHRWNPTRTPEGELFDYGRSFEFGDLLDLTMFETRLSARDETLGSDVQAEILGIVTGYAEDTTGAAFAADLQRFPELVPEGVDIADPAQVAALAADQGFVVQLAATTLLAEANDPDRDMVGDDQIAEFAELVAGSDAIWQVIGSQTLMARMDLPAQALFDPSTIPAYLEAVTILLEGGTLSPEQEALFDQSQTFPYNLDSWDGYVADREAILETLVQNDANGIVLSGDTHNAWFSLIETLGGELAAFEFGGPGVSAPGLEDIEGLDTIPPQLLAALFVEGIDTLFYADTSRRGYMEVEFTREAVTTDYVFVDSVFEPAYEPDVFTQTVTLADFDGAA